MVPKSNPSKNDGRACRELSNPSRKLTKRQRARGVEPTCEAISKTDVRVLYAREILTRFFAIAKLLKRMVARDGIEPPTPAFSGPLTDSPKWFEINGCY
jgi:hypothetical protein